MKRKTRRLVLAAARVKLNNAAGMSSGSRAPKIREYPQQVGGLLDG